MVTLWFVINIATLLISGYNSWEAFRIYRYARARNIHVDVAERALRIAGTSLALALLFIFAGLATFDMARYRAWFAALFIVAAVLIAMDAWSEMKYRRKLFNERDEDIDDAVGK